MTWPRHHFRAPSKRTEVAAAMCPTSRCLLALALLWSGPSWVAAGELDAMARTKQALSPRTVRLQAESMPLSEALALLHRETQNQVADRRQSKTDPRLRLDLGTTTFWPALEAIAQAAGCGI